MAYFEVFLLINNNLNYDKVLLMTTENGNWVKKLCPENTPMGELPQAQKYYRWCRETYFTLVHQA